MKKILIAAIGLLSLTSCRLDLLPESELIQTEFWKTEDAVNAAHRGVYANFRSYALTFWKLGEVRSDIWGGATIESPADVRSIQNNITVNNVEITNWANLYGLLHNVNDFIKNAPTVPASDQTLRNHMMGQMHGLRAYIYFALLKTWGEVPLNTEPIAAVSDEIFVLQRARSSKAEVASLIKEDIQKSLDYFGTSNSLWNNKNVFWSRSATLILKGEAYLFFGNVLGLTEGDGEAATAYETAEKALSQVSGFSLVSEYPKLWGTANENNSEFIFALDYQQDQAGGYHLSSFTGLTKDVSVLYNKEGERLRGWVGGGQNRYAVSKKVLNAFAAAPLDTRGDATLFYLYPDNNSGAGYPTYDETKLRTTMLNKFIGEIVNSTRQSYANVPIYRYADVLLLLAEAKNLQGKDPSTEINAIRKRAFGSNYDATSMAYTHTSQTDATQAILDERLKEFVGEGKRWWDLQRAGSEWVKKEVASFNAAPISGDVRKIYLPISVSMLDRDPNLKQTEGY